jgi:erythromycin esterase-like protein
MGDNVVWIADHLVPGRPIVVWGHAIHLLHDAPNPEAPPLAGTVMRRRFGAGYHVAHLTGLAGRYLDYETLQPHVIPAAAPDSLEARLARHAGDALYLAPPDGSAADAPAARYIDYMTFGPLPGRGLHWESTFFIRRLTPVTMVR